MTDEDAELDSELLYEVSVPMTVRHCKTSSTSTEHVMFSVIARSAVEAAVRCGAMMAGRAVLACVYCGSERVLSRKELSTTRPGVCDRWMLCRDCGRGWHSQGAE